MGKTCFAPQSDEELVSNILTIHAMHASESRYDILTVQWYSDACRSAGSLFCPSPNSDGYSRDRAWQRNTYRQRRKEKEDEEQMKEKTACDANVDDGMNAYTYETHPSLSLHMHPTIPHTGEAYHADICTRGRDKEGTSVGQTRRDTISTLSNVWTVPCVCRRRAIIHHCRYTPRTCILDTRTRHIHVCH